MGQDDNCNSPVVVSEFEESENLIGDKEKSDDHDVSGDDGSIYCSCRGSKSGRYMVECDNPSCQYQWYHYECVRIKRAPKGLWYCPSYGYGLLVEVIIIIKLYQDKL